MLLTRHPVNREVIQSIPTPKGTDTYVPVPYGDMLNLLEDAVQQEGLDIVEEAYGISREGNQMFGCWTLSLEGQRSRAVIGFRSSHDKSLPVGFVAGASILVCDNLCFSGDEEHVVRRHTKFVWRDIQEKIRIVTSGARAAFARTETEMLAMDQVPMNDRDFYWFLGDLLRLRAVNRQILGRAANLWENPPHEEFRERNLFTAYQAVNEALKMSQARDIIPRHTRLHRAALLWWKERADA